MDYFNWVAGLCARREYCEREIARKLADKGASPEEAAEVLQRLVDEGYVNDLRYAKAYVSDKFRFDHWGRVKIQNQLRLKGVNDTDIREALSQIDEEAYREVVRQFVDSRRRELGDDEDPRIRQKIIRAALSRGYEAEFVFALFLKNQSLFI